MTLIPNNKATTDSNNLDFIFPRDAIISYMRMQYPDADGVVDSTSYFQISFSRTYVSGGTEVTPVNMNNSSANSAELTCYGNNPILTGTAIEFDRWYHDQDMQLFNKHGSLILGLNDTLTISLITDQTSGLAYCRITIMMKEL